MLEFAKKINIDLDGNQHPSVTLIVKTDDNALITAITDTVRRFNNASRVIEEATIPAEDCNKLVSQELSLFSQLPDENTVKTTRNVACRRVEAIFEGLPQSVPFRTLGDLYVYMTGKDTARGNSPATHLRMLNKKRLPNKPVIVDLIRMDRAGRKYKNSKTAKAM
jgi:hypothetical protein